MSSLVLIPLSDTKIMSSGTSFLNLKVLLKSTSKVFKFLLLTPIISALQLRAVFISSSLCASTSADKQSLCARFKNSFNFFSSKIAQINKIQSAPIIFDS